MSRFNIFALESLETEEVAMTVIEPDQLCNGIISSNTETEIFEQGNDQAQTDAENATALFGIKEALSSEEAKDISPASAEVIAIAVEHLCRSSKLSKRPVFAIESFGGKTTRNQALKLATESISDHIKAAIAKIIEWIKKAAKWIFQSMKNLTDGAGALLTRARKIQEQTKGLASMAIKPGVHGISDSNLVPFFSSEGKLIEPSKIPGLYKADNEALGISFKDKFLLGINKSIKDIVAMSDAGKTKDEIVVEVDNVLNEVNKTSLSKFTSIKSSDTNFEVCRYACAFGQQEITVTYSTADNRFTGLKVTSDKSVTNQPTGKASLLKILTATQIEEIAAAVENEMLHGLFKDNTKTISEISAIEKLVETACNNVTRRQNTQESVSDADLTYSVNFLREMAASVLAMSNIIHKLEVHVSKNCLDYCEQSIKQYVKA